MTSLKTARRAAFAILAACAAQLALRAGTTLWRKIEIWRVLHGLEPLVAPDADAGAAPSFATETISFSVVSSGVLLALSLLGVALVERVLADLRVPERHRAAPPRGATSLAIALGAVLFAATAGSVAGSIAFAAAVRPDGVPGGAWLAHAQFALSWLETLASAFVLAALPFCLLRLAGRRFAAPPAGSPADAALRRAEAWLSIALAGGAAALVGDVAWTALEALPRPFVGFPGQLRAAALACSLVQPVLALSVLAAARDMLRRLLAAGELPSAPGGRIVPLVAVAGLAALAAAFFLPADLAAVRGGLLGTEMRALHDMRLAAMAALAVQFVFCAALLRRLPVPPGAQPAPPPPAFAGPARARIGLALAVAALACPLLDAHATAAAALAAAVWLGATARGGRFVAIRIALAAAALGAAVLLAGRLFPRLVLSDGPMSPRAYTEPARIGWNDLFVSVRMSADGAPVRNRHEWSHWTEDECALLAEWAADMEGSPVPGLTRFPGEPLAMVGGDPLHRAGSDAIVHATFYPDLVTFLNGDRFFAREPTPLDLRVLVALGRQVETDPAAAEFAEDDSHAESAEGAEDESHAVSAEGAEDESHAVSAEGAEP